MAHLGYSTCVVFGLSSVTFARPFASVRGSATFAFSLACLRVPSWTFSFTRVQLVDSFPNSSVCPFVIGIALLLGFGVCPPAFICLYLSHVIVITGFILRAVVDMVFYLSIFTDIISTLFGLLGFLIRLLSFPCFAAVRGFTFWGVAITRVRVFRCFAYADEIFLCLYLF